MDDVMVLYAHSTPDVKEKFEIDKTVTGGLTEVIIYYRKSTSSFARAVNAFNYFLAIRKGMKFSGVSHSKPDILHAYILTRTGLISWYLSRRWKLPYIISEQWSGFVTGKFLKSNWFKRIITRYTVKKANALTCVSEFLYRRMKECGVVNPSTHVIPNVISKSPVISGRNESSRVSVLLVADLVDEIKNISGVIRMIAGLETEIPFSLRIIGRGPDEVMLKNLAAENGLLNKKIFFEGLKPNHVVLEYLQRSDFLLMNSRYETFSLICVEAMSCGKPVLATRCGGPDEFITPQTGILFEVGNASELKKNFLYMLNHFREFNSEMIKDYSYSLFSKEKISAAFHELFRLVKSGR